MKKVMTLADAKHMALSGAFRALQIQDAQATVALLAAQIQEGQIAVALWAKQPDQKEALEEFIAFAGRSATALSSVDDTKAKEALTAFAKAEGVDI